MAEIGAHRSTITHLYPLRPTNLMTMMMTFDDMFDPSITRAGLRVLAPLPCYHSSAVSPTTRHVVHQNYRHSSYPQHASSYDAATHEGEESEGGGGGGKIGEK